MTTEPDPRPPKADVATLARLYELMTLIAAADRRAADEARAGTLKAAFYPVRGLEAVCAAIGVCTTGRDHLVSTYRNLGDAVAKGVPLERIVGEYFGRSTGTSKGQGGPMHLVDVARGLMATSGIVGGGLPIAVGLGLAAQLDADERVVVATFGDGATSIGAFHESLNLASLWKLPVVFVCQNNQWGEHTPVAEYSPIGSMAGRAAAYAMASATVDGFDAPATLAAMGEAVHVARAGRGPTLLECVTYRLTPHVATMEMSYMPEAALEDARRREAVPAFRRWLAEHAVLSPEALDRADALAADAVEAAFAAATAAGPPDPSTLYDDVFADKSMVPGR